MVIADVPVHVVIVPPALATGCTPHDITLVALVLLHPLLPVSDKVAVNEPEDTVGVKIARAGSAFWVNVPSPPPPLHVGVPEYVPDADAPVKVIALVPVHVLILLPAVAVGAVPQVITLVAVLLEHPFIPVKVNVAVNEPDGDDGVKVASAGLASWVNVPGPAPLHTGGLLNVPEAVAPVRVIALVPVQDEISAPAVADVAVPHVIVRVAVALPQPLVPVSVSVAVKDPLATVGTNCASAGFAS
jgi:hypothetical protein